MAADVLILTATTKETSAMTTKIILFRDHKATVGHQVPQGPLLVVDHLGRKDPKGMRDKIAQLYQSLEELRYLVREAKLSSSEME
jgi:hypothetical protein